jgi:hypothetical protein
VEEEQKKVLKPISSKEKESREKKNEINKGGVDITPQ